MKVFLLKVTRNGSSWDRIYGSYTKANNALLKSKRDMAEYGYEVVNDNKENGKCRFMQMSRRIDEGENAGMYAYVYLSLKSLNVE